MKKVHVEKLAKFNPYHDEKGRFTTSDGDASSSKGNSTTEAGDKVSFDAAKATLKANMLGGRGRHFDAALAHGVAALHHIGEGNTDRAINHANAFIEHVGKTITNEEFK